MTGCLTRISERYGPYRWNGIARLGFLCLLSIVASISLDVSSAFAFKISPFDAQMSPAGPGSKLDYLVENDSSEPVAVQISMVRREQAVDGSEKLSPADDTFLIFPAQLILLPKEKRTVRIQWLGPVNLEKELAYRLVAEQLPVDLGHQGAARSNVQLLVRYLTAVYIVPAGVRSDREHDLKVQRAEPDRDTRGRQILDVDVANDGLTHVLLQNVRVTARSSGDGRSVTLSSQRLAGSMLGENILAGSVRRFSIPWPPELSVGQVSVALEMQGTP